MKKSSKLRGIRAEVLQESEMKSIYGGNGSGIGSGSTFVWHCYNENSYTGKTYATESECKEKCYGIQFHCFRS